MTVRFGALGRLALISHPRSRTLVAPQSKLPQLGDVYVSDSLTRQPGQLPTHEVSFYKHEPTSWHVLFPHLVNVSDTAALKVQTRQTGPQTLDVQLSWDASLNATLEKPTLASAVLGEAVRDAFELRARRLELEMLD